jgi:hypothetical protein
MLVDGVLDDRNERRHALGPHLHPGRVVGRRHRLVAVPLEVLRVVVVQRGCRLLVVCGRGERDGRAVFLALLRRPVLAAHLLAEECERVVQLLQVPHMLDG